MLKIFYACVEILAAVTVFFGLPSGIRSASVQLLEYRRDQIALKCQIEGLFGNFTVEWFRNSQKVGSLDNIHVHDNRLIIRHPSQNDNGLYRCIAFNSAGRSISKKSYILKCFGSTEGNTTISNCIHHVRNEEKLSTISPNVFLYRRKRGEGGDSARGMIYHSSTTLPTAEDIRIIEGSTGKLMVKESTSIQFPCQYYIPSEFLQMELVYLRWRKDGKIFRQVGLSPTIFTTGEPSLETMLREDNRITLDRQNGSLTFQSVIPSDAGLYNCEIYSEGSRPVTSNSVELKVIEQLKFVPQPTSKNLEWGSVGKVHCRAQGTPTPIIRWIRTVNSKPDLLPAEVGDYNGTLVFKNVSGEDRGNYTCIALNAQGQINTTISINVVVAPRFSLAPQGLIEATERGTVGMHCQAIGDPPPTIKWDKDLKYLTENNTNRARFRFFKNGTLEIRDVNLEDEGLYGCTIGNSAGLKREEVHFIVRSNGSILSDESSDGFLITRAVFITVTVAFAYIILVVGLMIWCRFRRQTRKSRLNEVIRENVESCEVGKVTEIEPCLSIDNANKKELSKPGKAKDAKNRSSSGHETEKSDETVSSVHSKGPENCHTYDSLMLRRSDITEIIQVGRGEFGDVFVGKIKFCLLQVSDFRDEDSEFIQAKVSNSGLEQGFSKTCTDDIEEIQEEQDGESYKMQARVEGYKLVLIKELSKIKDESVCQEFKRQTEMFRAITHKGVVRLLGFCSEKYPHCMVLEHTDWGDLKQFLLATASKNSDHSINSPPPLKTGQILAVAYQIARGMDSIYRARFIHKDLATRNCVISSNFIVKVSCPALSKDKYSREYYKHRNMLLPVRWLAPECILDDQYTTKSDIFAFGVVVWELFHKATKIPFDELSNGDIIQRSQAGKLDWKCAAGTPVCLHEILMSCWTFNPKKRPSFSQLCAALSKAMENDK